MRNKRRRYSPKFLDAARIMEVRDDVEQQNKVIDCRAKKEMMDKLQDFAWRILWFCRQKKIYDFCRQILVLKVF